MKSMQLVPDIGMHNCFVEQCVEGMPWREALDEIGRYDFVHTFDFHRISAENGEGDPVAFIARDESRNVLGIWPALRRHIAGSDNYDLTSVYGYGGPIFRRHVSTSSVICAIFDAMRESGAISLFSRMHPLFVGEIEDVGLRGQRLGEVVVVPIDPQDSPPHGYRGSHRREIIKGIKSGITITDSLDLNSIAQFKKIYDSTMESVGAKKDYIFDEEYYRSLTQSSDFHVELLVANLDNKAISAAIFIYTSDIVQYYLSGTLADYRKLAPSKILIAEAHRKAIKRNARHLILGGGVGSSQDALFRFKAGFSELHLPFYVTRKVLDQARYDFLCKQRDIEPSTHSYFPAYRI